MYAIDTIPHRLALASKASPKVEVVDFKQVDVKKHIHEREPQGLDGASGVYALPIPPYSTVYDAAGPWLAQQLRLPFPSR